nr:MAG TPA: hypothetical protein [Caudoviricetes sp.]
MIDTMMLFFIYLDPFLLLEVILFQYTGGVASHDRVRRDRFCNDTSRSYDTMCPNCNPLIYTRITANPNIIFYYRAVGAYMGHRTKRIKRYIE